MQPILIPAPSPWNNVWRTLAWVAFVGVFAGLVGGSFWLAAMIVKTEQAQKRCVDPCSQCSQKD